MYFGTGLVKTAENFGSQGEAPSHPELLDWLATEFVAHRLEREGDAAADRDFRRLPAVVSCDARDARTRSGEPSDRARPPCAFAGRDDSGSGACRLRIAGHEDGRALGEALSAGRALGAAFGVSGKEAFRALDRRGSVAQERIQLLEANSAAALDDDLRCAHAGILRGAASDSSTPLQALALLNDEMYIETSRKFAERMVKEGGASPARDSRGQCVSRRRGPPTEREVKILEQGLNRRLAQYRADPAAAEKLLAAESRPGTRPSIRRNWRLTRQQPVSF